MTTDQLMPRGPQAFRGDGSQRVGGVWNQRRPLWPIRHVSGVQLENIQVALLHNPRDNPRPGATQAFADIATPLSPPATPLHLHLKCRCSFIDSCSIM